MYFGFALFWYCYHLCGFGCQCSRCLCLDKSLGDTSDLVSDSSGVGTSNSDTPQGSAIVLPGTHVVCLENYSSTGPSHLRISQGDLLEGLNLSPSLRINLHFSLDQRFSTAGLPTLSDTRNNWWYMKLGCLSCHLLETFWPCSSV